jgi:Tfp pilus assembly protein PilV
METAAQVGFSLLEVLIFAVGLLIGVLTGKQK